MRLPLARGRLWACGATLLLVLAPAGRAFAAPIMPGKDERPAVVERQPVVSTSIASVGYAAPARLLEIQFRTGVVYRYAGVPPPIVKAFLRAKSKGQFFSSQIRGRYAFVRVETPP